jgi:hypothetical protein
MANITPQNILPGYDLVAANGTVASESLCIPLSSLPGLTAVEADETTGDGRKVAYELCKAIQSGYTALATAARPSRMTASKGTPSGVDADTVQQSFTFSFQLGITGTDVAAES